jgi:hypothetical protein
MALFLCTQEGRIDRIASGPMRRVKLEAIIRLDGAGDWTGDIEKDIF